MALVTLLFFTLLMHFDIFLLNSISLEPKQLRVLLYIGPHKTGSSTVEDFIFSRLEHPGNRYRFYVPFGFRKHQKEMCEFPLAINKPNFHSEEILLMMKKAITSAKRENQNLIIAAEEFDQLVTVDKVKVLAEMLVGFNFTVVVTYRERLSNMLSNYNQILRTLETESFKLRSYEKRPLMYHVHFDEFMNLGFPEYIDLIGQLVRSYGNVFGLARFI